MNTGEWLKTRKANRKKTILVVDDEGFLVDVIFEILDSHGYSVLTATSGEEALQVAKKAANVDLLLTDLIMKPMNGPQLAAELKKRNPNVKVLFMSGYTLDYIRENLGLRDIAFLIKPLSAQDLLEKIPQLLEIPFPSDQQALE
jgi:two-component system, cell cycle sensor histidine kinase and response regulator CckA